MSRKTASFGQLLDYINRNPDAKTPAILHNLKNPAGDLKKIEGEFLENCRHMPRRKNGVVLYHEILSFSVHDKTRISPEIALDLGKEYLQLRAPEALAYARVHLDKDAMHLHLMISGNLIGSSKKLRLTKKKFHQVKRELESIQRQKYPELTNSLVFSRKEKKLVRSKSRKESERQRRQRKAGRREPSDKERVIEIFRKSLVASSSENDFKKRIGEGGLSFYVRGKTAGLLDGHTARKFRLKTLGLLNEFEKAREGWKRLLEFKASLTAIEWGRRLQEFAELGFKQDILEVLNSGKNKDDPPHVQKRKDELRRVAKLQREMRRKVLGRNYDIYR